MFLVCLYYSVPPYENVEYITAVANIRPTDITSTNFPLNPLVNNLNEMKLIV
jgi:hypothetical protein